jgi:predicted P-loop ATPase
MQWAVPRPLYGLERLTVADVDDPKHLATVLIVEGEKCADEAAAHLPALAVLTWSGGSKAVDKADWSVLAGRKVIIWPDCDAQKDKAGVIKPESEQPGIVAAQKVAGILTGLNCKVWLMSIPKPGEKPSGWDVADAIAEGMHGELLEQYIRTQSVWFSGSENIKNTTVNDEAKQLSTPNAACAGGGGSGDVPNVAGDWLTSLKMKTRGGIEPCMANIAKILRGHPTWAGVIGFNDFSKEIEKLKPTPWGDVGPWQNIDDLRLCEWRADFDITIKATSMISEAVSLAADDNKYHPVREWLDQLPAWDGTSRLACYLADITGSASTPYLERAGRWFVMAMVARIYQPGVKFDYALVLEGAQGQGKSSFFRVLADPWFSETSFEIGSNEGVMSIQGTWLHEMAEMGQMARAEDTAFKSFLAYQKDKFRRPYDRRPQDVPRVCLFGGTTNLDQYFKDHTGNRRIWPVRCDYVDTALLTEIREQLFAEAIVAFKAGERFWPIREEEKLYFEPEQEARMPVDGWEELIARFVYDPDNRLRNFFTAPVLLMEACKVEKSKIDEGNRMTARVGRIMKRLGWERDREPSGRYRSYGYVRPPDQRVIKEVFSNLPEEY